MRNKYIYQSQALENACEQVTIGFASRLLRKWRVFLINNRENKKTDLRMETSISKSFWCRDVPNMIDD